jgi:hypothetical protein
MRLILIAVVLGVLGLLGCTRRSRPTEAGVRATVDRFIPLGSDPQHTLRVLDSLKVEHSAYGNNRIITANFGESQSKGLVSGAVYVTLYFDEGDRLVRTEVKERFTGP